jgi:hypothetical protein
MAADSLTSVYSNIARAKCQMSPKKLLSQVEEHETITYTCRTQTGYDLLLAFRGTSVGVSVKAQKALWPKEAQLGAGYDIGDTVEWRGRGIGAAFAPEAAILRLKSRGDDVRILSVLGVLRIEGEQICAAAFIDAGANKDANLMARATADEIIGQFQCGRDRPKIIGARTELAAEIAAYSK